MVRSHLVYWNVLQFLSCIHFTLMLFQTIRATLPPLLHPLFDACTLNPFLFRSIACIHTLSLSLDNSHVSVTQLTSISLSSMNLWSTTSLFFIDWTLASRHFRVLVWLYVCSLFKVILIRISWLTNWFNKSICLGMCLPPLFPLRAFWYFLIVWPIPDGNSLYLGSCFML